MELICLNTWGARTGLPFFEFIKDRGENTDIFCLQEVWSSRTNRPIRLEKGQTVNQLQQISSLLPAHVPIFCPFETNLNNYDGSDPVDTSFGVAIFIKSQLELVEAGECFVFRGRNTMVGTDARTLGRNIQHIAIRMQDKILNIFNFHGLWTGNGKSDTPERLVQSRKVREYLDGFMGAKILAGDFNLLPDTKSFSSLSAGLVDLNRQYNITNTRSNLYNKEIKFADYILTTNDIKTTNYQVLPNVVSDHLALELNFDI